MTSRKTNQAKDRAKAARADRLDAEALFRSPLIEPNWAVHGLEIGPGRPTGFWGRPGSGKTWVAQEVAISVAAGVPLFNTFDVEPGKVLHLSYDLGSWALRTRYRQLANAYGISFTDLDGQLEVFPFPEKYLNDRDAEEWLTKLSRGCALVIVDCLRDAVPGADENSSEIAGPLKTLARVSEATGCTMLYLHHVTKGEKKIDIDSGRGSSAISAASGAIWALEGSGDADRTLRHIRPHDASSGLQDSLTIRRSEHRPKKPLYEVNGRPAVSFSAPTPEELDEEKQAARDARTTKRLAEGVAHLLSVIKKTPGASTRELRELCRDSPIASKSKLDAAVSEALRRKLIRVEETKVQGGTSKKHFIAGAKK